VIGGGSLGLSSPGGKSVGETPAGFFHRTAPGAGKKKSFFLAFSCARRLH
jgi:hypothetical protein